MQTKSTLREKLFVQPTSPKREAGVTLRLAVAKDEAALLEMGMRIAELRKDRGLTQEEISDYVGVDKRAYQFWQAGDVEPKGENLRKLAKILKTTPKYILRGETPELLMSRQDQLDRIETELVDIKQMLAETSEAAAKTLADVVARLEAAAESSQTKAPERPATPKATRRRKSA